MAKIIWPFIVYSCHPLIAIDGVRAFCPMLSGSRFAFSKNNQPTILPIPDNNAVIGKATQMSPMDILRINRLYKCSKWFSKEICLSSLQRIRVVIIIPACKLHDTVAQSIWDIWEYRIWIEFSDILFLYCYKLVYRLFFKALSTINSKGRNTACQF